ncbi:MAG: N-6 DNA methylase [bacterium]|nr:N-6 DNA methylase [bacterium]
MTEHIDDKKLRGGYYTPPEIAGFICRWAISSPAMKVLEPSCGDGNFVEAGIKRFKELGASPKKLKSAITGIELLPAEAEKARSRTAQMGLAPESIITADFFEYFSGEKHERYDVIAGNPPFIRYQNFPEEHREIAIQKMKDLGLRPNKLTNIWVPFLVISSTLLSENGRLGMVVPAELFQVKYAAETRIFLSNYFERMTIVTFRKLVFSGIQQEVVLLLCEKKVSDNMGIRVVEFDSLNDLVNFDFKNIKNLKIKPIDHTSEKWTKYFLENNEIELLRKIKKNKKIPICIDIMDVDVGIVTGRNNFFLLSDSQVREWKLRRYVRRIVGRSNHLKGIILSEEDYQLNAKADYPVNIFVPPNKDFDDLPKPCRDYITYGEEQGYHTGYKCRIRKRWYITPSLWNPDAFALRQVNEYPKLILNTLEASATDTIHRVRLKSQHDKKTVIYSYLNSLTFAFSEITGRSYGGGVLTFEPTEVEELPIPISDKAKLDFDKIDALIRDKQIDKVLDLVDKELLIKHYKFSREEISILRGIWRKLSGRRINRK